MKAKRPDPTREWKKESTVFADVEAMKLGAASARVYDCAGQVRDDVFVSLCVVLQTAVGFPGSWKGLRVGF